MKKLNLAVAGVALTGFSAFGAGFALYEGSASGTALGGAVMGKAVDASALFYNPATMSDFTNVVVTAGFVTEHPTADTAINGHHGRKMDPGAFVLPHAYAVVPLPYDFSFGLGFAPEFGLGTHYNQDWEMAWNTRSTFVEGLTFNPNISYRITDKWSVAAGIRLLYFKFDQYSSPQAVNDGNYYGSMRNHLKGDNGFTDWGWELSTRYRFTDKISAGILYKSYIDTKVKGYNHTRVKSRNYSAAEAQAQAQADAAVRERLTAMGLAGTPYWDAYYAQAMQQVSAQANAQAHQMVDSSLSSAADANTGSASAEIRLPQSLTIGGNWDVTDTVHLGSALTWTEWSSMPEINFHLPSGVKTTKLNWHDVYRIGFGGAWDFHENFTLLGSYVYDMDPCSHRRNDGSTMLPPGDRHIGTIGLQWHYGNLDVTVCYGLVFMMSHDAWFRDSLGNDWKFDTHNGLSQSAGVSVSYRF